MSTENALATSGSELETLQNQYLATKIALENNQEPKKQQKLTDASGLYINESKAALTHRGNRLQLRLTESFGVVKNGDTELYPNGIQAFAKVDWQIEGYSGSGDEQIIVSESGTSTTGDVPFRKTQDFRYIG